jgi:tetratricopeptide (TPR) repeat protein
VSTQAAVFVGRVRELAVLDAALAAARSGRGRVVLVVGEPGIGKTCVAGEFARRAREAGAEVLAGRCYEGPGAPAFWPWAQVVRGYASGRDAATLEAEIGPGAADVAGVIPDLHQWMPALGAPPLVSEAQARFRVFEALTRALVRAAVRRPIVIVLEDLHGADPSSLLLLQFLAREVGGAGVVVVGTLRSVSLVPGQPLADTLGELVREGVSERMELAGLDIGDVAELMTLMAGEVPSPTLAAAVHARTEGNPLYVMEVVRALITGGGFGSATRGVQIPPTVRSAIGRHLGTLSAPARWTITLGALFGREFRANLVARAGGLDPATVLEHVDEVLRAHLVVPLSGEPGRYRFAHALFGETLVEALGEWRRVALHRDVARALAADARADALVPEIAHHWLAAGSTGDPEEAVGWARRAGDRAFAVLAYEEAGAWYEQALTALGWTGRDDPPLRAELLLGLGEAAKRGGAQGDARRAFEKAAVIARAIGSADMLTRAAIGYAPASWWGEHMPPDTRVVAFLEEAIAAWHGRDGSLHARALVRLAMAMLFGNPVRRSHLLTNGVAMARRVGDEDALRAVLVGLLSGYEARFDCEGRLEIATELVRLAEAARDLEALAVGRLWRCVHLMECGDLAGSVSEVAALEEAADELRQPTWQWHVVLVRAIHELAAGTLAEAERIIERAAELGNSLLKTDAVKAYHVGQMLYLGLLRGNPDPVPYRSVFGTHPDPVSLSPLAWAYCEIGQLDEARKLLEALSVDDFAVVRGDLLPVVAAVHLSEAAAALGDAERAAALARILAPHARHWIVWAEGIPLGPTALPLGLLARTMGCLDEALAHFEFAVAESRRTGARPYLARGLYEQAVLLRVRDAAGDASGAAALLAEADAVAEAIGMDGLRRKIAAAGVLGRHDVPAPAPRHPGRSVFRREADYWIASYGGTTVRLRDARGFAYLAVLLRHPDRELHATDVVRLAGGGHEVGNGPRPRPDHELATSPDLGHAGPLLDARAHAAYRARLAELRADLAEAEGLNDLGRVGHCRAEITALVQQLAGAKRGRTAAAHGERARVAVTKGLKAALERIAASHPELGRHLTATVRRGYFCVYRPDPVRPVRWDM